MALGVDAIELDVAVTADGVAVVFHDVALHGDIARGPDGAWLDGEGPLIRSLGLAELARFDVGRLRPGSAYAALYPAQVPCDGARVPTLLETFAATAPVRIDAELKTEPGRPEATVSPAEMAERVLAVAAEAGGLGRLDVRSFDWRGLRHVRALRPDLGLTFLTNAASVAEAALWWDGPTPGDFGGSVPRVVAAEAPGACWAPGYRDLTQGQVRGGACAWAAGGAVDGERPHRHGAVHRLGGRRHLHRSSRSGASGDGEGGITAAAGRPLRRTVGERLAGRIG